MVDEINISHNTINTVSFIKLTIQNFSNLYIYFYLHIRRVKMKKQITIGIVIVLLVSVSLALGAKPNQITGDVKNTVTIPSEAVQVAPNVFYLGTSTEKGKKIQGYAFIDYKKGYGKPGTTCGNGVCETGENAKKCPADCSAGEPKTSKCYGFLARGAKWKTVEPYMVDPSNIRGLSGTFVRNNLAFDISKWETVASTNILGDEIGDEIAGIVDGADLVSPDNKNEVYFADIGSPGAIAITIVWGYFYGPPGQRELVEWDQVYDDVDYDWSATGEAGKMDFENIATHELGHSVGLDDLYNTGCSEETMYGYADYGETKKRTLEAGDKTGVKKLYN